MMPGERSIHKTRELELQLKESEKPFSVHKIGRTTGAKQGRLNELGVRMVIYREGTVDECRVETRA